jgi:hypothetical protein
LSAISALRAVTRGDDPPRSGELDRAVTELEQVVELDRQVGHPDLQSDTEMLHRVRQELASLDPGRGSR